VLRRLHSGIVRHLTALAALGILLSAAAVLSARQREVLNLINDARADRRYRAETGGLAAPLRWNPTVAEVARRHSQEMARAGRLSHLSNDGEDLGVRLHHAGVVWTRVGENVAMAPSIEQAEAMLMAEPPFQPNHRANILDRRFTQVGIGVAEVSGAVWITEDFLTH
jgi:uncharacterized protein YkwD